MEGINQCFMRENTAADFMKICLHCLRVCVCVRESPPKALISSRGLAVRDKTAERREEALHTLRGAGMNHRACERGFSGPCVGKR